MKIRTNLAVVLAAVLCMLPMLASSQTLSGYSVDQFEARRAIAVEEAVVIDVLPIEVQKPVSADARFASQAIGGLLGAALGSSRGGSYVRAGAVGIVGGLIGDRIAVRAGSDRVDAVQLVLRLRSGRVLSVIQEVAGTDGFRPGDAVYLMNGQTTRVVRASVVPHVEGSN